MPYVQMDRLRGRGSLFVWWRILLHSILQFDTQHKETMLNIAWSFEVVSF